MDKKQKYSNKFNIILKQLLQDTKNIVGTTYLVNFNIVLMFSKDLPIKTFCKYCLKYKKQILSKNPDYFLNTDLYERELSDNEDKSYYLNEILNLKEIYTKVDDESKENLWDILGALVILSEKYIK